MSRKLHRGRTRVFHKRKFPVKAVAWLLAAAVIIPGSFFGAKYMLENRPASQPDVSVPPVSRPADASSQDSSQPADPSEPNTPAAGGALKAFYLPTAQLADSAKLSAALSAAKAAGLNAVVFDLKDSEGNLLYASGHRTGPTGPVRRQQRLNSGRPEGGFRSNRRAGDGPRSAAVRLPGSRGAPAAVGR